METAPVHPVETSAHTLSRRLPDPVCSPQRRVSVHAAAVSAARQLLLVMRISATRSVRNAQWRQSDATASSMSSHGPSMTSPASASSATSRSRDTATAPGGFRTGRCRSWHIPHTQRSRSPSQMRMLSFIRPLPSGKDERPTVPQACHDALTLTFDQLVRVQPGTVATHASGSVRLTLERSHPPLILARDRFARPMRLSQISTF
jgi:hypothetical protein